MAYESFQKCMKLLESHFFFLLAFLFPQVSFSTNHYGAEYFEAVVTVNLTAMLVTATLFITINNGLPKTSSIKLIDVWMIFALSIPFMEVILHTTMAWIRRKYVEIDSNVKSPMIDNSSNEKETKTIPNKIAWDKQDLKMNHTRILRYPSKYAYYITYLLNIIYFS